MIANILFRAYLLGKNMLLSSSSAAQNEQERINAETQGQNIQGEIRGIMPAPVSP